MENSKKVLWFSRHNMSTEQLTDLKRILGENITVEKLVVEKLTNVHVPFVNTNGNEFIPLKHLVNMYDEFAAVLPIGLQQQILGFDTDKDGNKNYYLPAKRFLMAQNDRVLVKQPDGSESKVKFVFAGWDAITEIVIKKERL